MIISPLRIPVSMLCIIILLIALPSQDKLGEAAQTIDNFTITEKTFKQSGLEIAEIKLQAWGQISNRMFSEQELREKYGYLVDSLGLEPAKAAFQRESDGFISLSHLEANSSGTWQISLQSIPVESTGGGETYLGFLYVPQTLEHGREAYGNIPSALEKIGFQNDLGLTFTGIIPNIINEQKKREMLKLLAKGVQGEFVEGISTGDLTSLSYYTQQGKGTIIVNGRKINLNMALHGDTEENKTYFYVGMPLIYQEY